MITSSLILLITRNFWEKIVEKIKTHILLSIQFYPKTRTIYERENVEIYGKTRHATDENIIRRMNFGCRLTKATDTPSKYEIYTAFPGSKNHANESQYLMFM